MVLKGIVIIEEYETLIEIINNEKNNLLDLNGKKLYFVYL